MSSRRGFRTGSNSYGQFWFGGNSFPGFLYKKNVGVGGRRSTRFTPGGTTITNQPNEFWNKYKPGNGGVGASSIATRRAKMIHATVCEQEGKCGNFYKYLGLFDNYTGNGLKAAYPYLTEKQLLILIYLLKNKVPYEDAISTVIYPPVFLLNSKFIPDSDMPKSINGNMLKPVPNTYLAYWFRSTTNPDANMTLVYNSPSYSNYSAWFDNYNNIPPPGNSNVIAFQNASITDSNGIYLYQNIDGPLYKNVQYVLTFYAANRGGGQYEGNPNVLYLYFKINNQTILTNYNPSSNQSGKIQWTFVSIPFVWNQETISNPIFTFGQVHTVFSDKTIFITQPILKLNI